MAIAGAWGLVGVAAFAFAACAIALVRARRAGRRLAAELQAAVAELAASRERFDLAQEIGGVGAWEWDILRDEGHVSDAYRQMHGLEHVQGPLKIAQVMAVIHPDDLPGYAERLAAAKLRPEPSTNAYRVIRPDGSIRFISAKGRPLFDPDGRLVGAVGIVRDVTADEEAAAALAESRTRLELAVQAAGVGVWEWRLDTGEMIYSPRAREICGLRPEGPVTLEMVSRTTHPDDQPRTRAQAARALDPAVRERAPYEYRVVRRRGEVRWVIAHGHAVFEGPPGAERATRYIGALIDVTEAREREERLLLLAREVDHRANNLLAVVQGAVELSRAETAAELKRVISGRIQALARAHQLLSEARWRGADLGALVKDELLAFSMDRPGRVEIAGPEVALAPAAAQGVAMALHELATNASKYGALSTPEGQVRVSWSVGPEGALAITWRETGGPPVAAPARRGFGTTVLDRALGGGVGGDTLLDWRREGLVCELRLPPQPQPAAA